jgi:hypothetical protein
VATEGNGDFEKDRKHRDQSKPDIAAQIVGMLCDIPVVIICAHVAAKPDPIDPEIERRHENPKRDQP